MRNIRQLPQAIQNLRHWVEGHDYGVFPVTQNDACASLPQRLLSPLPLQGGAACHDCFPLAPPPTRFPTLAVGGITRSVGGQAEEEGWGGRERERWRHCHVITVGFPTWRLG